jgi:two-component system, chemotaxis family, CheB/CheR fusion protein
MPSKGKRVRKPGTKGKRPATRDAASKQAAQDEHRPVAVVGLGASAGGLDALLRFLSHMPSDSGMAFVIVQHLSREQKSIMDELLQKHTAMKVCLIEDGMAVEANGVYLNPPGGHATVRDGVLHLEPYTEATRRRDLPIDRFFTSLAADQGDRAICVVLSGTGADGTLGLEAVKSTGGMTIAQQQDQAQFGDMPRHAVESGLVDLVLPVEEMPAAITRYAKGLSAGKPGPVAGAHGLDSAPLDSVFSIVYERTGRDFSHYKSSTVLRRINRRMAACHILNVAEYAHRLRKDEAEVSALCQDMLISVTSFFRDPQAFEVLAEEVVPKLLEGRSADAVLRVWVPACGTGEEAYSIAILLVEAMEKRQRYIDVQIFATDLYDRAIEVARAGTYPDTIAEDVSPDRLAKFFIKEDSRYTVKKTIRERIVFAAHDLVRDPPFSKTNLISCRNVLIYMDVVLQRGLLRLFHYSLNENGFLFLGSSEALGDCQKHFSVLDKTWRIFRRKTGAPRDLDEHRMGLIHGAKTVSHLDPEIEPTNDARVRQLAEKTILEDYAPPCILINEKLDILYFHGETERYLCPPTGEPSFNILRMAKKELRYTLGRLLRQAAEEHRTITREGLGIQHGNQMTTFDLVVRPLTRPAKMRGLTLVVFESASAPEQTAARRETEAAKGENPVDPYTAALEQELESTKDYLETTIRELETSYEDLRSTNEEFQAANEELQSTNEELETSREELQSTNEELETVNAELKTKVDELAEANSYLSHLLSSTDIGMIFLDLDLRIKRFTPSATWLFNLIAGDVGRPIGDISTKGEWAHLVEDIRKVLETLNTQQREVCGAEGKWFLVHLLPYRTPENVIDGVVITFTDITELRKAQERTSEAQGYREYAESIIDTVHEPLLVVDGALRAVSANRDFYRTFGLSADHTKGRLIYDLGDRQWDIPELRRLLEEVLPQKAVIEEFRVDHPSVLGAPRPMQLSARELRRKEGAERLVLIAFRRADEKNEPQDAADKPDS